ncbi:MAG: ubiquinone/menaquinone biosynthesis methyltransferase [Candidatus Eisenbacteria bacterium]|nr:ubiquinone/menaquinone biosynthesis methyltransferase [Candidatus Eisenbacteria bacterium]
MRGRGGDWAEKGSPGPERPVLPPGTKGESVPERRAATRRMFDGVSGRYDALNRVLSLGLDRTWRRRVVRSLGLGRGDRFLDVACGTADLALAAAEAAPEGIVVGVDFSAPMLRIARRKAARRRTTARMALGAAESLPFRGGSFAAAGIAFGVRNVPDRAAALREMARAVRPGGRVAVLEFIEVDGGFLDRIAGWYLRRLLPRIGGLLSDRSAYEYLTRSVEAFPPPDRFLEEMRGAGLLGAEARRLPPAPVWLFTGTVPPADG